MSETTSEPGPDDRQEEATESPEPPEPSEPPEPLLPPDGFEPA
ncbi:hypothetical protein [Nonomuraea sp. C10]|nr:hypothetical protein [Nonomuraea sp. C10]